MVVGTHQIFSSFNMGIIVSAVFDIWVSRDLTYLHIDTFSSVVN